jgi:hypothetical protein
MHPANAFYQQHSATGRACQIESWRRSAAWTALDQYYVDDGPSLFCWRRNGTGAASESPTISIAGCRASVRLRAIAVQPRVDTLHLPNIGWPDVQVRLLGSGSDEGVMRKFLARVADL